jgi:hypothetical protein
MSDVSSCRILCWLKVLKPGQLGLLLPELCTVPLAADGQATPVVQEWTHSMPQLSAATGRCTAPSDVHADDPELIAAVVQYVPFLKFPYVMLFYLQAAAVVSYQLLVSCRAGPVPQAQPQQLLLRDDRSHEARVQAVVPRILALLVERVFCKMHVGDSAGMNSLVMDGLAPRMQVWRRQRAGGSS